MSATVPAMAQLAREPDFLWGGRPVFRCRVCGSGYERVENLAAVLEHERAAHPEPAPVVRQSPILGPDGEPLVVVENGQDGQEA